MLYRIEVRQQGQYIADHVIEAISALAAIDLVETYYGQRVKHELVAVEDAHCRKRQILLVDHWHGYTFDARAISIDETGSYPRQENSYAGTSIETSFLKERRFDQ